MNLVHEIPGSLWEATGADIFNLHNTNYLYIVDYHSKFLIVKIGEGLLAHLIKRFKIIFEEYGLPRTTMSL